MEKNRKLVVEPIYLGFSTVIATLLIYEPALHSFVNFGYFETFIMPFSLTAFASCAIYAIVCITLAQKAPRNVTGKQAIEKVLRFGSTALGAGGFLLLVAFEGTLPLQIASGFFAGISAASVLLAWGETYAGCSMQKSLLHIALSCVIAVLLMNTMGTLPFPITAVLFCLLTAASAILPTFWNERHVTDRPSRETEPSVKASLRPVRRMLGNLAEPLIGIFLFSLVFATLGDHRVYLFYLSFLMGTLLSGLCIIPLLYINSTRPILSLIYQVILPVLGLVLIVVTMIAPDSPQGIVARNGSIPKAIVS